jgi:hypothetical protein
MGRWGRCGPFRKTGTNFPIGSVSRIRRGDRHPESATAKGDDLQQKGALHQLGAGLTVERARRTNLAFSPSLSRQIGLMSIGTTIRWAKAMCLIPIA